MAQVLGIAERLNALAIDTGRVIHDADDGDDKARGDKATSASSTSKPAATPPRA